MTRWSSSWNEPEEPVDEVHVKLCTPFLLQRTLKSIMCLWRDLHRETAGKWSRFSIQRRLATVKKFPSRASASEARCASHPWRWINRLAACKAASFGAGGLSAAANTAASSLSERRTEQTASGACG